MSLGLGLAMAGILPPPRCKSSARLSESVCRYRPVTGRRGQVLNSEYAHSAAWATSASSALLSWAERAAARTSRHAAVTALGLR